jgi:hypothetical protein
MNTILRDHRIARHDYDEAVRAYGESGGPDLEDQVWNRRAALLEQEDAIADRIESFGFVEAGNRKRFGGEG